MRSRPEKYNYAAIGIGFGQLTSEHIVVWSKVMKDANIPVN
jgi:hypothetical protein